jgi:hypothetical protein
VVRVRPRLPGPFERIEAVGAADEPETEEVAAPWPATRDTGPRPGDVQRALRETRTEREHTVLHTERAPEREDPVVHGPERPGNEPSLLRPTISPLPRQPRAAEAGGRRPGQGGEPAAEPPGSAGTPLLPGAVVASPSASGVPRPASPADAATAAVREAARAAARRGPRGAERVVHVQIGRLEVSAAGPAPGAGRQERAPARRAPAVGLEDYLRRGRDGDGRR